MAIITSITDRRRLPLILPLMIFALVAGLLAGLVRIGWDLGLPISSLAARHGAIIVGSFLGTLICLERVMLLKQKWAFILPVINGSSLVFFFFKLDQLAFTMLTLGSVGQAILLFYFYEKLKEQYLIVILTGSLCWLVGNLLWLTYGLYPMAVPWWMAFLLFTITGERLELTKFLPVKHRTKMILYSVLFLFVIGIILPFHGIGKYLAGAGCILTGLWLLRYDMARKAIKYKDQHRYSAINLLLGYGWLVLSGLLFMNGDSSGFIYNALVHTFFIGFVFAMIFAHGPIILPGILGVNGRPYHPVLYLLTGLLHCSLVMRIAADLAAMPTTRMWSGLVNGVAIFGFFIVMAVLTSKKMKLVHDQHILVSGKAR